MAKEKDKIVFDILDSIQVDKMEEKKKESKRGRAVRIQVMTSVSSIERIKELDARVLNFGIKLSTSQLVNLCIKLADFSGNIQEAAVAVVYDDKRRMPKNVDELIERNHHDKKVTDEFVQSIAPDHQANNPSNQ
jgi:hypothetical protein